MEKKTIIIRKIDFNKFTYEGNISSLFFVLSDLGGFDVKYDGETAEITFDSYDVVYNHQKRNAGKKCRPKLVHSDLVNMVKEYGYEGAADKLGVDPRTVKNWIKNRIYGNNMPKKVNRKYNPKKFDIDINTLIEEKKEHTYKELAEKYGCSVSHLQNLICKAKKGANNE